MTGEPGRPEKQQEVTGKTQPNVEKRTSADAEAALRQFEQDRVRQEQHKKDAIAETPLPEAKTDEDQSTVGRVPRAKWFKLRQPIGTLLSIVLGVVSIALIFCLWWYLTRGEFSEERIVNATTLPSPSETFGEFKEFSFCWNSAS